MAWIPTRLQSLFSKWRLIGIILLLTRAVHGQTGSGVVAGVVFDSQTGRPVAGVSVAINGQSSDRNVTDADGRFSMNLSAGTYTLRFTATKYAPVDVEQVVVKAGE